MIDKLEPVSRRWRRFLRLSVRGLVILVLLVGSGLGWWIHRVRDQRATVASIRKAGGTVLKHLPNLRSLNLNSTPITDRGGEQLKHFRALKTLAISRAQLSDEGVPELRRALPKTRVIR